MTTRFLHNILRPTVVFTLFCLQFFPFDLACQERVRPQVQHVIKTPLFGLINPLYPEFQIGYGFQKADKWAIHLTGGLLYDLGTYEVEDEHFTKYGGRGSISFRWMLTHDERAITDWFLGLRAMGSQLIRKKQAYFWDEEFNFQQWLEIKGVTDSYSFLFDAGLITNHYKRTALELFIGIGSKTYRRRHPGLPANISPRPLYNFFERGHIRSNWKTVPAMSFNFNFIYRFCAGKSKMR